MKSSLSMVKCLLLFTRFCRDKISSRDELIPVKKTGMKFPPGMKKRRVNTLHKKCPYSELFWSALFPHFPAFRLNKERSGVSPTTDTFYAITLHPRMKLKWACFCFFKTKIDVCIQICFLKLTCLNIMRVWVFEHNECMSGLSKKSEVRKEKGWGQQVKKSKMLKHFYYFYYFLCEVYKKVNFILL